MTDCPESTARFQNLLELCPHYFRSCFNFYPYIPCYVCISVCCFTLLGERIGR